MTTNTRPCYQLSAKGNSRNGWAFKMKSRAIFLDRADADKHIPEFRLLCTDDEKYFESAHEEGLEITIIELELYG